MEKSYEQEQEKSALPAFPLYFLTCSLKANVSLGKLKCPYLAKAVPFSWLHGLTLMVHFLALFLVRNKIKPSLGWANDPLSKSAEHKDLHFLTKDDKDQSEWGIQRNHVITLRNVSLPVTVNWSLLCPVCYFLFTSFPGYIYIYCVFSMACHSHISATHPLTNKTSFKFSFVTINLPW